MLIKDFIKSLEAYNPEAEITTPYSEDILLSYMSEDFEGNKLTKETIRLVFIEWLMKRSNPHEKI